MSNYKTIVPRRALSTNFTEQTLRRSLQAKKRMMRKSQLKGLFSMNKLRIRKQPVGILSVVAFIALSGTAAYAAVNWFNGSVNVSSGSSILSVDVSQCQSSLPPGVDSNADRKNIQFKILGTPHIDEKTLQAKLLAGCELASARTMLVNQLGADKTNGEISSVIKAMAGNAITLEVSYAGQTYDKMFTIDQNAAIYSLGQQASLKDLHVGDTLLAMYTFDGSHWDESKGPSFEQKSTLNGIFRTQYDTRHVLGATKDDTYASYHIMPLDQYNLVNSKK